MPKLNGLPGLMSAQVVDRLGRSRQCLSKAGVFDFLEYWKVGRTRLYDPQDVADFRYWLHVRDGLIALNVISPTDPLLPPGETDRERRSYFDGWVVDDLWGTSCPVCDRPAVQAPEGGPIWCMDCGILEDVE